MVRNLLCIFKCQVRLNKFLLIIHLGLGDWPTHVTHIKRGKIVAFHDFNKDFPELDNMISRQIQLRSLNNIQIINSKLTQETSQLRINMDSPLLKVVEQWLREDLREIRLLQTEKRKKSEHERDKVLLCEEKPITNWDILSDNVEKHGDKYYNYW